MQKRITISGSLSIMALAIIGVLATGVVVLTNQFQHNSKSHAAPVDSSVNFNISNSASIGNQDGTTLSTGEKVWYGVGKSADMSYLAMAFTGSTIPAGAVVKSATVEFTAVGAWISVNSTFYAGKTTNLSSYAKISEIPLSSKGKTYSDNVKWEANKTYTYDVTEPVAEVVNGANTSSVVIVAKGVSNAYARKYIYGDPSTGKSPKLHVVYTLNATKVPSPTVTTRPTTTPTLFPTVTARSTATPTPTVVGTITPTSTPTAIPHTMSPMPTSSPVSGGSTIYGAVSADLLGTCSQSIHDKYVVTGPDGKLYRTWHAAKDPSGCTFSHEHGDNPATSNIYAGPIPFDYIAAQIGMDEPHAGFKCFVHNKGNTNDEGGSMLHNSYYCFHMGTGGAARFTTQFHSLDFHMTSVNGAVMNVQGLADVGQVGTICDSPRRARTVMGLGCKVDSSYEIWENTLRINNKGNTIATAIASTAVFDPITLMDPADKTKAIPVTDPSAFSSVFKFNDSHASDRGCDREAYSGPLQWNNGGGSQVYYTDVYGNVVNGGALKQTISTVNTAQTGAINQYGGLIMAYKGGNEQQAQFKMRKSSCVPGLGLKN